MEIIRGLYNVNQKTTECVITIGNFDGFHLGHQQLVTTLLEVASRLRMPSVLMTFEPQPNEFFSPDKPVPRLMRFREKCEWLQQTDVDYLVCARFNKKFAAISPEDFITELLIKQLGVKVIIIGDDFRFGAKRAGDYALLKKFSKQYDFEVVQLDSLLVADQRVSSTGVRAALAQSQFKLVQQLLGRPYFLSGKVSHGNRLGREIGFPTANVFLHRREVPLTGIFVVRVLGLNAEPLDGVAYVGIRSVVGGTRVILEVHIFNFDRDIYGEHIEVEVIHKIRDDQHFDSVDEMVEQIQADIGVAKAFIDQRRAGY